MEIEEKDFRKELTNFSAEIQRAFSVVPREFFLPEELKSFARQNHAIMVDEGSSVSQPSMIAFMLDALDLRPGLRVLEIGSGSGYVLALLCALDCIPVGIEINEKLAKESRNSLKQLSCEATVIVGNASQIVINEKFDRILFSAALNRVPEWCRALIAENGLIVCPLGTSKEQELVLISEEKMERTGLWCRFVPFVE